MPDENSLILTETQNFICRQSCKIVDYGTNLRIDHGSESNFKLVNPSYREIDPSYERGSLIAGLGYGMERWNGKRNGTMNVQSCS